jgi:hypothetical protein
MTEINTTDEAIIDPETGVARRNPNYTRKRFRPPDESPQNRNRERE